MSTRTPSLLSLCSLLPSLCVLAGCADDDFTPSEDTETGSSTGTGSGTEATATATGGSTTATTGEPGGLDCPAFTPPSGAPFTTPAPDLVVLDTSTVCAGLEFFPTVETESTGEEPGTIDVDVYYPGDESEDPADGPFPVVVFHHGNGLDVDEYGFLFEQLQASGFIVLNVDAGESFGALEAIDSLRCALRWFYLESSYFEEIGSCEVVLAGHSRGGAAAQITLAALREGAEPDLEGVEVRAMVMLASADPGVPSIQEYLPDDAVPLLALGSSTDEDVPGQVLVSYDRMVPEDELSLANPQPTPYKGAVWIYDLPHGGFGGVPAGMGSHFLSQRSGLDQADYIDKGHTITASYVDRFLRWQIFGDDDERPYFFGEAFPDEVLDPEWWDYLVAYRGAPEICTAIGTETPCTDLECAWTGSACEGTPSCDTFDVEQDCLDAECLWEDAACTGRVPIFQSFMLDTRSDGERFVADLFEHDDTGVISTAGSVATALGDVGTVIQGVDVFTGHDTSGVLASITSLSPGASVTFATQPPGVGDLNHASLRIGTRTRIDTDGPIDPTTCDAEFQDSVPVSLQLSDGAMASIEVPLQRLPQQDAMLTFLPATMTFQCEPQMFLHTQRIPMAALCEDAMVDVENIDSWTFSFPDGVAERDEVVIDTLEFTQSAADAAVVGSCPTQTAVWACEASTSILPQRAVCSDEPVSGACPSESIGAEGLDVPEVPSSWGGPFDGWVVHMPAGYGDDPWDPPSELVDAMTARCVSACEQQWSYDAAILVDCSAENFVDVSLLSTPSDGPLRRISPSRVDGSGLFENEALPCSLLDDCCLAFDENVCLAAARRTTPASYPIGVGQEYEIELDSDESAFEVTDGTTTDSVKLYGDVGFSRCRDGNDSAPCPFYLGSLSVKSIGSIVIPVTCPNQSVVNRTLWNLELDLAQPAMGIAQEGTDAVGFPADALVFEARFTMNSTPKTARGVSQVDAIGTAGESTFEFGEIKVTGMMPACWGQDDIAVQGTFELVLDVSGGTQESPPTLVIDIPSTVSCPSSVDLDATVGDPDSDLDVVRWYIDDVLLEESATNLTFSEAHTVRAVAYDDRGAATTAVKTVTCQ